MAPKYQPVKPYKKSNVPGVATTSYLKRAYKFQTEMMMKQDRIRFSDRMFTRSHSEKIKRVSDIKDLLKTQLHNVHWDIKEKPNGTQTVRLTGKTGDMEDDLFIAFSMLCYWSMQYYNGEKELTPL